MAMMARPPLGLARPPVLRQRAPMLLARPLALLALLVGLLPLPPGLCQTAAPPNACASDAACPSGCCSFDRGRELGRCQPAGALQAGEVCHDHCRCADGRCERDPIPGQFSRKTCAFPHMVNAVAWPLQTWFGIKRPARNLTAIGEYLQRQHGINFQGFAPPRCAAPNKPDRNLTRFNSTALPLVSRRPPGACPLADETFCDEWDALDTDCDGLLDREELSWTQTLHTYNDRAFDPAATDFVSHRAGYGLDEATGEPNLPPQPFSVGISSFPEVLDRVQKRWTAVFRLADTDGSGRVDFGEFAQLQSQLKNVFRHCGEALAVQQFRFVSPWASYGAGKDGPYPVQACESCAVRWLHCDLSRFGGGWTLVYETVGAQPDQPLGGEAALNEYELFTASFRRTQDPGIIEKIRLDGVDDWLEINKVRSYRRAVVSPHLAKLSDDEIRPLCTGQYMIVQPQRRPLFCMFETGSESYGDQTGSVKHCSRSYDAAGLYGVQPAASGDEQQEEDDFFNVGAAPEPEPQLGPRYFGFSTGEAPLDHTIQVRSKALPFCCASAIFSLRQCLSLPSACPCTDGPPRGRRGEALAVPDEQPPARLHVRGFAATHAGGEKPKPATS
eukprot:SAG22_NODE_1846_length_3451_cov_2.525358_4_plen_614_part_00